MARARTDAGVHAHGPGDRIHLLAGDCRSGELAAGARGAPAGGRRGLRSARGARRASARATRRGTGSTATPIWNGPRSPLRERYGARGAGAARRRGDGRGGAGPRRPARLLRLRRRRQTTDPDPSPGAGPQAGSTDHHRRGRRRLPAPDGPQHRGRPPARRDGEQATTEDVAAALRSPRTGLRRRRRPAPRAAACDGWSSDDAARRRGTGDDDDRTYTPRAERDRAPLVRRRRRRARRSAASRRASRASSRASTSRPSPRTSTAATTSSWSTRPRSPSTRDKLETKLYIRHSGYPRGLRAGDARRAARATPRGGHPPRRQGHAAAQQAGRPAAAQAQDLRGRGASARGAAARAAA